MSYRVTLTATAVKERRQIGSVIRKRIDRALLSLQTEPRPPGVKKLSGKHQDWRFRVGDYRILYEIDDEQQLLTV